MWSSGSFAPRDSLSTKPSLGFPVTWSRIGFLPEQENPYSKSLCNPRISAPARSFILGGLGRSVELRWEEKVSRLHAPSMNGLRAN